jgi:ribonuclease P protein component
MLPKQFRITKKTDFEQIFNYGQFYKGKLLTLATVEKEGTSCFGIIVSKSVLRKSTERNRIKRIIRNFIAMNLKNIKNGKKVLIMVKTGLQNKSKQEIEQELGFLFRKAGIC